MVLVQMIIAHRGAEWVLLKQGVEHGSYTDLASAKEVAEMLAQQVRLQGDDCEILIHDGDWRDEPCPEGQGTPA